MKKEKKQLKRKEKQLRRKENNRRQMEIMLLYIPKKNPKLKWQENEKGRVILCVERYGFYDKIAQKILKKPKKSFIELDKVGTFIWKAINGKRNIEEIGVLIKDEFKENAEPLYERLFKFIRLLKGNDFI